METKEKNVDNILVDPECGNAESEESTNTRLGCLDRLKEKQKTLLIFGIGGCLLLNIFAIIAVSLGLFKTNGVEKYDYSAFKETIFEYRFPNTDFDKCCNTIDKKKEYLMACNQIFDNKDYIKCIDVTKGSAIVKTISQNPNHESILREKYGAAKHIKNHSTENGYLYNRNEESKQDELIKSLQKEIDKLKTQAKVKDENINDRDRELQELKSTDHIAKALELTVQNKNLSDQLADHATKVKQSASKIKELSDQIDDHVTKALELTLQNKNLSDQLADHVAQVTELNSEKKELSDQLAGRDRKLQKLESTNEGLIEKVDDLGIQLDDRNEQYNKLNNTHNELLDKFFNCDTKLQNLQSQNREPNKNSETLETEIAQLKAKIKTMTREDVDMNVPRNEILASLTSKNEALQGQVDAWDKELNTLRSQNEVLTTQVDTCNNKLKNLTSENVDLITQLNKGICPLSTCDGGCLRRSQQNDILEKEVLDCNKQLNTLTSQNEIYAKQIDNLQTKLETCDEDLKTSTSINGGLQKQVIEQSDAIRDLTKENENQEKEMSELIEENETHNEKIDNLQEINVMYRNMIYRHAATIDEQSNSIGKLKEENEKQIDTISELTKENGNKKKLYQELVQKFLKSRREIQTLNKQIEEKRHINKYLGTVYTDVLNKKYEIAKQEKEEYKNKLEEAKKKIANMEADEDMEREDYIDQITSAAITSIGDNFD